ncbi:MAG TPA: nucleotide exchange factor GrpE [Candidatus Saccharimonadales bacterium]|jgi:molecular chaperone GrpE
MAGNPKKPKEDSSELKVLKDQLAELTEALKIERADAINIRRRAEEDRLKMANYFKASVIKELLPFIDNFDRALKHLPKTNDKATQDWLQGLSGINKQLEQALTSLNVQRIKTVGEVFDPRYHEAVQMDSSGDGTKEIVTEEFMSGYTIDDEVIRHAMVKVAVK